MGYCDEDYLNEEEIFGEDDEDDEVFDDLDDEDEFEDDEELDDDDDIISEDRLLELESLGSMDGQQDGISGSWYTGYGMSVEDLDDLSEEEKDAYESGYMTGFGASGGWG